MSSPIDLNAPIRQVVKRGHGLPELSVPPLFNGAKYRILLIDQGLRRKYNRGWRYTYVEPASDEDTGTRIAASGSQSLAVNPCETRERKFIVVDVKDQTKVHYVSETVTADTLQGELFKIGKKFSVRGPRTGSLSRFMCCR